MGLFRLDWWQRPRLRNRRRVGWRTKPNDSVGSFNLTTEDTVASFSGTHTAPANSVGTLSATTEDTAVSFSGTHTAPGNSVGTLDVTTADTVASFSGTFSAPGDAVGSFNLTTAATVASFSGTHTAPANSVGSFDLTTANTVASFSGTFAAPGEAIGSFSLTTAATVASFSGTASGGAAPATGRPNPCAILVVAVNPCRIVVEPLPMTEGNVAEFRGLFKLPVDSAVCRVVLADGSVEVVDTEPVGDSGRQFLARFDTTGQAGVLRVNFLGAGDDPGAGEVTFNVEDAEAY